MEYQQLRIDIKTDGGITQELYDAVCKTIAERGGQVMDDAHGPYTEDMSDYYPQEQIDR